MNRFIEMTRANNALLAVAVAAIMALLCRHGEAFGIPKTIFLLPRLELPTRRHTDGDRVRHGGGALKMQSSVEEKHGGKQSGGSGDEFRDPMLPARIPASIQTEGPTRILLPIIAARTKALIAVAGATVCLAIGGRAIVRLVPRIVKRAVSVSLIGLFWYKTLVSDDRNKGDRTPALEKLSWKHPEPNQRAEIPEEKRTKISVPGMDLRANPPDMIISF